MPPRLLAVGTKTPAPRYTQEDLLRLYGAESSFLRSLFLQSHIATRHLVLPPLGADGRPARETQGELLRKHQDTAIEIGSDAMRTALARAGLRPSDIAYLSCVTTTGYLTPGLSALFLEALGLPTHTGRLDVVGMGCNAGLNGLQPVVHWAAANPGKVGVVACVEICSAAYVMDDTVSTAVVNSLFGDGAACAVVSADDSRFRAPVVLGFESHTIPEAIDAMRYDWDDRDHKFRFTLDREIPYVIGAHVVTPVERLLHRFGLRRRHVAHWIVHSGGKKVVDAIQYNLGLSSHAVRHTASVLHDLGNVSSGSFLFSYERLLEEGVVEPGEYAVMITMGPGTTIETALLRF
jgi:3,5-dihydroxyphenylacetyl-CoA synthase